MRERLLSYGSTNKYFDSLERDKIHKYFTKTERDIETQSRNEEADKIKLKYVIDIKTLVLIIVMATTNEKVEKIVKIVREETKADIVQKISSEFCIPVDEILIIS